MKSYLLFLTLLFSLQAMTKTKYHVGFPNVNAHYVSVSIEVNATGKDFVSFKMPVWTPGSYKVREFSQHVDFCSAKGNVGDTLEITKSDKSTWRVACKGQKTVTLSYQVYAFEISVRQSYADQFYAFLHGVSVFMYAEGFENEAIELTIDKPSDWKNLEIALPIKKGVIHCDNYDLLADSPIALGNFEVLEFESQKVPHRIVMMGQGNYDKEKVKKDFKTICDETGKIIGENPCKEYIHFIQNVENASGGLEHLNCQTSQMFRWGYTDDDKYKHLLSLVAHEYFHLWNVKRLRPAELGPFDYEKENYTTMLWIAEGFTAYFDDLIMKRAGYYSETEYMAIVSSTINKVQNQYGHKVMPLSQSSFNSWIKTYLPNENSNNVGISYYQKGMLVALILDLEILKLSDGSKRLDDVMRSLYQDFYLKKNRGFTESEFITTLNKVAGHDLSRLVYDLVHTTKNPDYAQYLSYAGLTLFNQNGNAAKPYPGIGSKEENGRTLVNFVELESPASKAGLSASDEIIAVNNYRVNGPMNEILKRFKPGETLQILVNRGGQLREFKVVLDKSAELNYTISKKDKQEPDTQKLLNLWLGNNQ